MRRDAPYRQKQPVVWAFRYSGQPYKEWPRWLQTHYSGQLTSSMDSYVGRVAVASKENGRKTFWRWFDSDKFREMFELQTLQRS